MLCTKYNLSWNKCFTNLNTYKPVENVPAIVIADDINKAK